MAFIEQLYPSDDEMLWSELKELDEEGSIFVLAHGQSIDDIIHLISLGQVSEVEKLIETGKIYRPSLSQVRDWNIADQQLFKFLFIDPYIIIQEFNPKIQ